LPEAKAKVRGKPLVPCSSQIPVVRNITAVAAGVEPLQSHQHFFEGMMKEG